MSNFIYGAFTKSDIIEKANDLLVASGSRVKVTDIHGDWFSSFVRAKTTGNAEYIIVLGSAGSEAFRIRSVLRIINKRGNANWLHNGQPGKNVAQVLWRGEQDLFYCSTKACADFWVEQYSFNTDINNAYLTNKRVNWYLELKNRVLKCAA
jgi:hypothetical protein